MDIVAYLKRRFVGDLVMNDNLMVFIAINELCRLEDGSFFF